MTKTMNASIILFTAAMTLPSMASAQNIDGECHNLQLILGGDLPDTFADQRDRLASVVAEDNIHACSTELSNVRSEWKQVVLIEQMSPSRADPQG